MLTIIYPYKNRELIRMKKSLDSLASQTRKDFSVVFVDYGSDFDISASVRELLLEYEFVKYIHSFHNNQPWSRSKAINIGLRFSQTDYVFIADIDIIFHSEFIAILFELKNENKNIYFQVGYLDEYESKNFKKFENYNIATKSIPEGQGLSFFKLDSLLKIGGFDEFFHFWGAEDEDVHLRLLNAGFSSRFYDSEILLLHQWHKSFENLEKNKLTIEPILSGIFSLNKEKLRFNQRNNLVKVNKEDWGKVINKDEFESLNSHCDSITLLNKKHIIENFLNIILPNTHSKIINIIFKEDIYQTTLKYKIKKFLKVKTQEYYSLKQINDLILKTLLIYYNNHSFTYTISNDLKSIHFRIKK